MGENNLATRNGEGWEEFNLGVYNVRFTLIAHVKIPALRRLPPMFDRIPPQFF